MSKKTPVKKSKRRLKKTVRRSLAAILMISAIGVAAIPVPENLAAPGDSVDDSTPADSYEETEYEIVYEGDSGNGVVYSLDIYNGALFWQYKIDKKTQKVLQYNKSYPNTKLTLSDRVPTNYQYVSLQEFEAFRDKVYTLSAQDYIDGGDEDSRDEVKEARSFFETYYKEDQEYMDFKSAAEENTPTADFSRGVYNLSESDQRIWYCKQNKLDGYTIEPILVEIGENGEDANALQQINTNSGGVPVQPGNTVYIPKLLDLENVVTGHDEEGYLLGTQGNSIANTQMIKQIGNYAFADNGVLVSIELPDWLQSIGIGAFMKCSSLQSVSIPFLVNVPEAAFKNCTELKAVNWWMDTDGVKSSNLTAIAKEAFFGTGIKENVTGEGKLTFPNRITTIDDAAFYGSTAETIEFQTNKTTGVNIGRYAFYDNTELKEIIFNEKKVANFGDYCFAMGVITNKMQNLTLPNSAFTMGKKVFAKRSALQKIVVPEEVGKLQGDMLEGCTGLLVVEFVGATTTYDKELFESVNTDNFYVTGPARMDPGATVDDIKDASYPRKSTWETGKTAAGQYIPYRYTLGGKEYYEICVDGKYILGIDKEGTLTSCNLKDGARPENGILVIPDMVGDTTVKKIASDCFKNKGNITNSVVSLTIGNFIEEIADSTFASWTNLEEVEIGKSIKKIGTNAFANSTSLKDITFATPNNADYESLEIGKNSFNTNSGKLTIHGDLVDGYAPFEYAVDPNNYVSDRTGSKYRICYQSRWDSPSSKHMAVLYGEYNDGKGYVTLVDYPLWRDFFKEDGSSNPSADLKEHMRDMEEFYYDLYGNYTDSTDEDKYVKEKTEFAIEYQKLNGGNASVLYGNANLYGPWINPSFCNNWTNWLPKEETDVEEKAFNWLFEPITAYAAVNPTPYFKEYEYDFLKNYKEHGGDRDKITYDYYDGWTQDEENMIRSTEEIVIPAGVDSIDIVEYCEAKRSSDPNVVSNRDNYRQYFKARAGIFVGGSDGTGLFSGDIDDYYSDADETDKGDKRKGNDRIEKVDMSQSNIAYLPDYTFDDCEALEEVSLPASCASVGVLPYRACEKLSVLTSLSEDCPALDGIQYQKDTENGGYELVECLLLKGNRSVEGDSTIPSLSEGGGTYINMLSSIAERAFEGCKYVREVDLSGIDSTSSEVLPKKLSEIPAYCFKGCEDLQSVILPSTVVNIRDEAFADIRKDRYHAKQNRTDMPRLVITIPGYEVEISEKAFNPKATNPKDLTSGEKSTIDMVNILTYQGTAAARYVENLQTLGYDTRLGYSDVIPPDRDYLSEKVRVVYQDYDGKILADPIIYDPQAVTHGVTIPESVLAIVNEENHRPGYKFSGFFGQVAGELLTPDDPISSSVTFVAQYESDGTLVNGKCAVYFIDGIDGSTVGNRNGGTQVDLNGRTEWVYYIEPGANFAELDKEGIQYPSPRDHKDDGKELLNQENPESTGWYLNNVEWKATDPITTSPVHLISLYKDITEIPTTSGNTTNTSGNTTNNNGNTTNNNGSTTNNSGNTTNTSNNTTSTSSSSTSTTSSSTSSSSTSTSSTTSGSGSTYTAPTYYTVTVENGMGSGSYVAGATVVIAANPPAAGMKFNNWTTSSTGVNLASVSLTATTFTMPANNVTVTANYVADTTPTSTAGTTGGTTTPDDGSTRVDITKPGISNKDLATADVNGSTDNFIVKITETDEATQAVAAALTNKYNSLDNILYYAMDISLYDSTGTTKITDVSGLSIDITIPLPDALIPYGGNNMAGAVVNGNQLENLNERFTTVNGVPMVTFTATHFSPYTIYVDTGNLSAEGMLDVTPKTGDPIHPKWFLSIGLACLSIILFIKKDKTAKKMA